jgi:NAD(P)-dependent dehydrogenase (short-subunit alcohol dehydrogenase family)
MLDSTNYLGIGEGVKPSDLHSRRRLTKEHHMTDKGKRRVVIITGGGGDIGGNAALEIARQGAVIIAVDSGVGVQGEALNEPTAAEIASRIRAQGGTARSSTISVTDREAMNSLFEEVALEFGSLDAVINAAGILRFKKVTDASEDDWRTLLEVHLDGYLNVLHAALPIMAQAGFGRIVGITSGSGLARPQINGLAYGCAKRAVAALTWQLAPFLPEGISVNVLSPIAASRMTRESIADHAGTTAAGLDLSAMPQPADMAAAAAYLSSEQFGWCSGEAIFSSGSEISLIGRPKFIEAVRTDGVENFGAALETLFPVVFAPGENQQRAGGGSNQRFGPIFDQTSTEITSANESRRTCMIISDDHALAQSVGSAITSWDFTPLGVGGWRPFCATVSEIPQGFEAVSAAVVRASEVSDGIDAVVVILSAESRQSSSRPESWQDVIDTHSTVTNQVATHGAWLHAVFEQANRDRRPLRVVHLTAATTPAGKTTAQALVQMVRAANETPAASPILCFSVALETARPEDDAAIGQLVARLVGADDASALAGAELAACEGWIGLRNHPGPVASFSFGNGTIPSWVDAALRQTIM